MKNSNFIKEVERLVNPIDVGTIHFIQYFNKFLPVSIQKKMVESSGLKTPYMGFVVEPYSYFLCYELNDFKKAKALLPKGFELIKTKIFEDDEPKYYGIFGCFNAHTSGFWGLRVECYIIAKNTNTGLMSWIIVDYDTNTITYDPKNGLSDPNANDAVFTTDYNGELHLDMVNKDGRRLIFTSDIKKGSMTPLDPRLWIEGNLSVAYGRHKSANDPGLFSLTFNPLEFKQGLRLPLDSLEIQQNNWFPGLFKDQPSEILTFPYAQHFLSDSPGHSSQLQSEEELVKTLNSIDFSQVKAFSTEGFKKSFLLGGILALFTNLTLTLLLLHKKRK